LIIVAGALALLFVRLGLWQLSRRAERATVNAARLSRGAEATLDWTSSGSVPRDTTGVTWRTVRVAGRYDREHEIVLRGRSFEGRPGVEVLTPLMVGDAAILVLRGWLPAADGLRPDLAAGWPAAWPDSARVEVRGTLIPPATGKAGQPLSLESRGREHLVVAGADLAVIAERLPYELLPHVVRLDRDAQGAAVLEQPPRAELTLGNHFSYAVQWFAFAAISLVGTAILVRMEGRA
ncbi:MAG: SURF1 family protein, partial [Gemmatimonadota bacterium]